MKERRPRSGLPKEAKLYYQKHFYEFVCTQIVHSTWPKYKPTWQQKDMCDDISKYFRNGFAAGHGVGKTAVEAWINIWFPEVFDAPCRVINTAPTGKQLTNVLWPEINRWLMMSYVAGDFDYQATTIRNLDNPIDIFCTWRTSDRSDNMQGFHAPNMFWNIEEAFGIQDRMVWEVIRASMTGDNNRLAFFGNYTVTVGDAHEAFSKDKALWIPANNRHLRTLNGEESPIVNREWLAEMQRKWGRDHDVYRTRVLGLPPRGNPDAFLKRDTILLATTRIAETKGKIKIGLDCARKGVDLTVFCILVGNKMLPLITMPQSDEVQIYNKGLEIIRDLRKDYNYEDIIEINMDNTGGYGSGAYDLFVRNKTDKIKATAISYSGGGNDMCINTTSILWSDFKDRLPELELPEDHDLIDELSTRKFTFRAHDGIDKLLIESKEDFKRNNNGVSPDRSDAATLATAKNAIRRKVWSFFPSEFTATVKVNWAQLQEHITPLISLWIDKTMNLYCVVALWNAQHRRLFIVGDLVCENPHAEAVIPALKRLLSKISNGAVSTFDRFEFFGNSVFFSNNGGDARSTYSKYNVNIRENFKYNEAGAILEVERLINNKKLYVDDKTIEDIPLVTTLPYDMVEWGWGGGSAEPGYGLCRALCNIASALYEGYVGETIKPMKAYSKEKSDYLQKITDNAQQRGIYSNNPIEELGDKQGWMV